jgi:predicted transcriptional regulator of viral defense system
LIANRIYEPSYISFESALAYYSVIPESIYSITSAAPKASREFNTLDTVFIYHRIKPTLYFGYTVRPADDMGINIAEPEKALLDYIYFILMQKKPMFDRMDIKMLNRDKLYDYARVYRSSKLEKKVETFYDK